MASRRKRYFVLVATFLVLGLSFLVPPRAVGERLEITVAIVPAPGGARFAPDLILLPNTGTPAHLTLLNTDTINHTFTIDAVPSGLAANVALPAGVGGEVNLTFQDANTLIVDGVSHKVAAGNVTYYTATNASINGRLQLIADTSGGMPEVFVRLNVTSVTEAGNLHFRFVPDKIIVGQKNTRLNITVVNVDPTLTAHTFSINPKAGRPPILEFPLNANDRVQFSLVVLDTTKIEYGGRTIDTAAQEDTKGIEFYCFPHKGDKMVGSIVIGGAATTTAAEGRELGVFLRAYWIGVIGILATILLTVISYWIIKGQSRHYRDHTEHVRKGLP